jgi:dephospho-CoA kinase
MASQLSEENFRKECQIVIDNSGDFEDTCYQIEKYMKQE